MTIRSAARFIAPCHNALCYFVPFHPLASAERSVETHAELTLINYFAIESLVPTELYMAM